jgi:Mce-associated membrane protein
MSQDGAMTTTAAPALPLAPPSLGVPRDLTASWIRRVVALLLDQALIGAAAFLTAAVVPVSVPSILPAFGAPEPTAALWTDSRLMIVLVVVLLAMQAYLGSTPGKLVMGIAVVRAVDGRPVGMIRTLLRLVAHVLDGILMIGYLRPLWNLERKTFADSLAGTAVLRTDRPLPFAARREAGFPLDWERPEMPVWRQPVAVVSVLACAAGVAMNLGSSGTAVAGSTSCSAMVLPAAGVPNGTSPVFASGVVDASGGGGTETRLGVERPRRDGDPAVTVRWDTLGLPAGSVARFAVLDAGGDPVWSVERRALDAGLSEVGAGDATLLQDGAARYVDAVMDGRWEMSVRSPVGGDGTDGSGVEATTLCTG